MTCEAGSFTTVARGSHARQSRETDYWFFCAGAAFSAFSEGAI